ncbi:hypothetical protein SKAU_G00045710 [Synaphobranchus kaupii]|uniref:Uncharacterized protein n=1 Tax=Synaphobranchus kaupii TaxID=118154 RepID=A0A9Q1G2E7_SYNKA|nr:hypothetical protein SKAU_G00045710 [Synaphobranchus kaupii]
MDDHGVDGLIGICSHTEPRLKPSASAWEAEYGAELGAAPVGCWLTQMCRLNQVLLTDGADSQGNLCKDPGGGRDPGRAGPSSRKTPLAHRGATSAEAHRPVFGVRTAPPS